MKLAGAAWSLAIGMLGCSVVGAAESIPPAAAAEPAVELPPLIVTENTAAVRWLYVRVGTDEYLSRCSPRATETFIASRERQRHALRAIVPDEFLARLPSVFLLYDASETRARDEVARDASHPETPTPSRRGAPVRFLPNLRIDDRDLSASCVFIDDVDFTQRELMVSADFLRFQLERRVPMLPPWLVEGILEIRAEIVPGQPSVTLRPLTWLSEMESRAIARDPLRPRALLSASEMFAPDALRGPENQHPLRARTLQAQVGLFVRWALDPRNQVRDAFWRFARQSAGQRASESLFASCFGFGFSDLRDRLNDYLPIVVKETLFLDAGEPPTEGIEVHEATPSEVLRLRGEWERLEVSYVRRSHADFANRYLEQALRTLRRGQAADPRDARPLASLGLCETEAGDRSAGIASLEQAIATGVNRPRPYYEVARFRFAELLRDSASARLFSETEIAPVVEPLRLALQRDPALPEVFGLLADAWMRCRQAPPASDLDALVKGANSFAFNPALSYRIALALARYGRSVEAITLLATATDYANDESLRTRCRQLLGTLESARSGTR